MEQTKKIYVKHHSFDNFRSNIGSDPDVQARRVLNILNEYLGSEREDRRYSILSAVVADLSSGNPDNGVFKITTHISDELSRLEDEQVVSYITHRYRYDIHPRTRVLDEFPPYIQIEPTSVCNYRCVFCYQTDDTFFSKASGQMGTMSLDMFKSIIDQIQGNIEFISLASRGEPLVCREIDKMLEYCVGKFLGLKVNTNASLLTEAHCHAILAGGVNTLVFSVDAAEEPLYGKLRIGGNLEKVLKNIAMFQNIKNKHYPESKIITRVSGVKFDESQDMEAMMNTWGELVEQIVFVNYNPWENVYNSPANSITEVCSDLWRRMFIWHDGKANPCDVDYRSILAIGNAKETPITKIWLSEKYQKLRDEHLIGRRGNISPCQACSVL